MGNAAEYTKLHNLIADQIRTNGPIPFTDFMATALYYPELGYYQQPDRKPGRGGDFITSPELHPFFGNTLARQIAEAWDALEQPHHLIVREHGASSGGLAYDILVALHEKAPDVLAAIDYRLVDVNQHRLNEAISAMAEVGFGDRVRAEHPDAITPEPGVVLANEVADALPVHRLTMREGTLHELYADVSEDGSFIDYEQPADASLAEQVLDHLQRHDVHLPDGVRIEWSPAAADWMRDAARNLTRGIAVVIDYGYDAHTLWQDHRLKGTLRGYYQHDATEDPYLRVGEQDLTAHVDFSLLADTAKAEGIDVLGLTTQGDYLTRLGLGDWLMDLQHQPDVEYAEYYRAQMATMRLIDPAGLGRFRVLGLARGLGAGFRALGFTELTFEQELAGLR